MRSMLQGRGADVLEQLRARTRGISEIIPLTSEGDFEISARSIWLPMAAGGALLSDSATTGVRYERTAAHVALGSVNVYQIAECTEGEMVFSSSRLELTLRPGDIFLVDMAQSSRTILVEGTNRRCRVRALVVPRSVLSQRLAHPDSATGLLYRNDRRTMSPLARQYADIWRWAENEEGDPAFLIDAIGDLIADAVGSVADTEGDVERTDRRLFLAMIKRYIETHLESKPLAVEDLYDRFGISRASLYRMFKPEGGLAGYVQDQRLNLAMRRLAQPDGQKTRLLDLAIDLHFSSDSTFVRAFRRKFGLTPGELRGKSQAWLREGARSNALVGALHRFARR
ncbi:helix-turn-helix transcriptional regulator [Bradyrhizobium genosp. P]|uniref:AraC family transcriptional regulator n=1 Tax=Bradyrhizobium genosp. P TaxID=83641 RepID=UPI003CEBA41E